MGSQPAHVEEWGLAAGYLIAAGDWVGGSYGQESHPNTERLVRGSGPRIGMDAPLGWVLLLGQRTLWLLDCD